MTVVRLEQPPRRPRTSLFQRRVTPALLLLVLAGMAVVRLWIAETAIVDGPSMEPTLVENDRVLVLRSVRIERFDIIVFTDPEERAPAIKRVVGLPGDVISILPRIREWHGKQVPEGGQLFINGTLYHEPYATCLFPTSILPITVPPGYYFVLGDNRDASADSRTYGPVSGKSVQGVAVTVIYPFRRMGRLAGGAAPVEAAPASTSQ